MFDFFDCRMKSGGWRIFFVAPFPSSIDRIFLFTLLQSLKKLICLQILEKMLQENWMKDNFVDHRAKVMREVRRKREKNSLCFIRLNYLKQRKTKNPFEVKHLKKRGRPMISTVLISHQDIPCYRNSFRFLNEKTFRLENIDRDFSCNDSSFSSIWTLIMICFLIRTKF